MNECSCLQMQIHGVKFGVHSEFLNCLRLHILEHTSMDVLESGISNIYRIWNLEFVGSGKWEVGMRGVLGLDGWMDTR